MANLKIRVLAVVSNLSFVPVNDSNPYIRSQNNIATYNVQYTGASGQSYTLGDVLFQINDSGSNFKVTAGETKVINGDGYLLVNVEAMPSATENRGSIMSFNSYGALMTINISYNSLPETTDIYKEVYENQVYIFTTNDFISRYFDYDGDPLTHIEINNIDPPDTGLTLNGNVISEYTIVSMDDIASGKLQYKGKAYGGEFNFNWNPYNL